MSLRSRLILPAILSSLAVLAACGGGNSNPTVTPPPSGGFSNSNLTGNYVFVVTGTFNDQIGDFVTIGGVFTADGKGNITGGVLDRNSTITSGLALANITSGTYNVGADGRPSGSPNIPTGLLTLQTDTAGTFQFDYALTSSEHGLMTEFDTNGSASGTLDLQGSVTQANLNGQSYVFNLTGVSNATGTVICNLNVGVPVPAPYDTVGVFTLDSSGNISGGVADFNNNCLSSGLTNVSVTGGSVTMGTGFATATITTTINGTATTYSFDVFPIDSTHLKLIETDTQPILVGDAFTQASSFSAGNYVYTFAGFDSVSQGPLTAAGILNTDSNGNVLSGSEDVNDNFSSSSTPITGITGSATALTGGRAAITLTGFVNGNNGVACSGNCTFAAYPSTGGLQLLEIDDAGMTNGTAYAQSATTLASGEGYGLNLSGAFLNSSTLSTNAEDDIAEFTNNNGTFGPGIIDFNAQGLTTFKQTFQANYAADSTISGRGTVTPTKQGYLLTTYVVDNSTAVAVSTDPSFVGLGALVTQNASAKSNVVAAHLAALRAATSAAHRKQSPTRQK